MTFLENGNGLVQNSEAWYKWRQYHIGASDVPSVMGTSDFGNAYGVFVAKTQGALNNPINNFATLRGKELEPVIIAKFEESFNYRTTQPSFEFQKWKVMSASLDGWIEESRFIVEAKAPSRIKHIQALCGIVPATYVDQVQSQLLVADGKKCYYVSYHPDEPPGFDLAVVEVFPDIKRQDQIWSLCTYFWELVKSGEWNEEAFKAAQDATKEQPCRLFSNLSTGEIRPPVCRPRKQSTQPQPCESESSSAFE